MAKSKTSKRYTREFRRELVVLHRAGRSIPELSREFGPTPWTIALWVKRADRDTGRGDGGLTTSEREELARLRRDNKRLKLEREILSKAAAWFAQETANSKNSSNS
jgi:transposase